MWGGGKLGDYIKGLPIVKNVYPADLPQGWHTSFEMVATSMEKKRLGLINKACVVVPKHLTMQMASEWQRLYPNSKLLVAHPEDFSKDNRRKFIGRCVTGDYDAVIMSFTQFERIPMSKEYQKQFMENELDDILDALQEVDDTDRVSVKTLEPV